MSASPSARHDSQPPPDAAEHVRLGAPQLQSPSSSPQSRNAPAQRDPSPAERQCIHSSPHTEPLQRPSPPPFIKRSASSSPRPLKHKVDDDVSRIESLRSEYQAGHVVCETCGITVSFRDETSGAFTTQHWDAHRRVCPMSSALSSPPPAKRRRAKRTEDERIAYLRSDPYVAKYEAYRVLCKSCDKWIRLRPNSTYCSIPWDAHRKSCLAKKITSKHTYALEQRNKAFEKDPDVRKFDAERVLCSVCDHWIAVPVPDERDLWHAHKAACRGSTSVHNTVSVMSVVQPLLPPPPSSPPRRMEPSHREPPSQTHSLPPQAHFNESRRRNAEQRAATLRGDSLILHVEPNRVFCSLCQKWVQLRQDSSYCAYPWLQHRSKCLLRSEKRAAKERGQPERREKVENDAESEDAEGSWDEEEPVSHSACQNGHSSRHQHHGPPRDAIHVQEHHSSGQYHTVSVHPVPPPRQNQVPNHHADSYLDLDNPSGRLSHLGLSIGHLLATTFRAGVPVAAIVGFMNASMPEDRWEEYDFCEVVKGVGIITREGVRDDGKRPDAPRIELEGDVVRPR